MKKKFLYTVLALSLSCVFLLSACSSGTTQNRPNNNSGDHKHQYTTTIVDPTCTEQGYTLHSCSCGDSYKDTYVNELGHTFEIYTSDNNATCLEDGTKSATCERCGATDTQPDLGTARGHLYSDEWSSDETSHWHAADCEHANLTKDLAGHTLGDWEMTKEPTRTEEGLKVKSCSVCGYEETQKIAKINYDYTEDMKYILNEDNSGYICTGLDYSVYINANDFPTTFAPHCLYNGLPVVGIDCEIINPSQGTWATYFKTIYIPETVQSYIKLPVYSNDTTLGCTKYTEIVVSENNPYFKTKDGVLYNNDFTVLIDYPRGRTASYFSVPTSVTEIGATAFHLNNYLSSVSLPSNLTVINANAFNSCQSLSSTSLPENLITIGAGAFYNCKSLYSLTLPRKLESLGGSAFASTNLKFTFIPDTLKYVSGGAYTTGGTPMGSSPFPQSMQTQYNGAYYFGTPSNPYLICSYHAYFSSGVNSVHPNTQIIAASAFNQAGIGCNFTIHDGVEYICDRAFCDTYDGTGQGEAITFNIGNGVKEIGEMAFGSIGRSKRHLQYNVSSQNLYYSSRDGVLYNKDQTELIAFPNKQKEMEEYTIPNSVMRIADGAFSAEYDNSDLLKKVTIPDGVEYIGDYAFYGFKGTEIDLPEDLTYIGVEAFAYSALTSLRIPDKVVEIADGAFLWCADIVGVTLGKSLKKVGKSAFHPVLGNSSGTYGNVYFMGTLEEWFDISFQSYHSNPCVHGHLLYIDGELLTSLVVPQSITRIKPYIFNYVYIRDYIIIHDKVTFIGSGAFSGTIGPQWILIGSGLQSTRGLCDESVGQVFYKGTEDDWDKIMGTSGTWNVNTKKKRYYFQPYAPEAEGRFWHYDTDGITPVIW